MSLNEMVKNKVYIIDQVNAEGELRHKLLNMGITPGVKIEFIRKSIFGDPLAFRVRDYIIALRKEEASKIIIKDINP